MLKYLDSALTASPLRFMNVSGFASSNGCVPNFFTTNASGTCEGAIVNVRSCRRAISSTTLKPML